MLIVIFLEIIDAPLQGRIVSGRWLRSRLRYSNRRRKEANSEGEQHEAAECIDRDVYRTDHLKIAELTTVSGSQRACSLKGPQSAWHGTNVTG